VNALVERDGNNNLVAKSAMTAMVDNAITGIINTATGTSVGTTIFTQMESDIDANKTNIAAIATKLTGNSANISVGAKLDAFTAGLITNLNLDSAVNGLLATSTTATYGTVSAAIMQNVSSALSAQQDFVLKNDLTSAYIIQKINGNQSETTIGSDKINIHGALIAENATITQLVSDFISGGSATFTGAV